MPEAQKASLPADLQTAEADLLNALKAALASGKGARWGATLRFENLRVLPVALRLFQSLRSLDASCRLLWPDAGDAALARRDAADFADSASNMFASDTPAPVSVSQPAPIAGTPVSPPSNVSVNPGTPPARRKAQKGGVPRALCALAPL